MLHSHHERRAMPDSNIGDDHKPFAATMKDSTNGAAALLLVESLIHGLIERSILSVQEAVDIIDIAADVERQLDASGLSPPLGDFRSLLTPIAHSLRGDLSD